MIKKITILCLSALTLFGCGDEIVFNSPAFQGDRGNSLWRAGGFNASINENGFLTITGINGVESVDLIVPSVAVGTYVVGNVNSIEARFTDGFGTVFSTNNRPDPSVSVYPELGEIVIEEIDATSGSFTGTFRFIAFDASGLNSVGFTNGIFFRVPLLSGSIPADPITCLDTEADTALALAAYQATFADDVEYVLTADYTTACIAYRDALQTQRQYCSDVDGSIQGTIDGLEGCVLPCNLAERNRNTAQALFESATIGNYIERCNQYQFYLQQQILICGDEDGSIQAAIDALNCADDDNDGVPTVFEDFNGDGDLDNDDIDGDGIPNYLDDDDDGDGVLTANETVDDNGNPIDTDGDGDVDYLDNDDDGDGLLSNFETGDTDGDGTPNYLDADDDGDGTDTINENADPNMDGDPADAVDTDGNGTPDYLEA
ncbi:MAG: DUF6252 family protein [Bacteroidota bacterium]